MNTFLWIVQILLAVAFLAAGFIAVVRSKEQLKATGMGWVDDYGDRALKRIGAAEILGACGLALPALLGIAPILVPLAATGLQTPPQSRRPSSTRPASSPASTLPTWTSSSRRSVACWWSCTRR